MRSVCIPSSQTSILKWTVNDVQKQPATKVSPIFDMEIGAVSEKVILTLSNYFNLIQIKLQPIQTLDLRQIVADASVIFRYGKKATQFDQLLVVFIQSLFRVEVSGLNFTTVTDNYQTPFEVELQIHLRPVGPLSDLSPIASTLPETSEPPSEQVDLVWQINEVQAMPLIKKSPLYTFCLAKHKHQILFTLETNKDRLTLRICPFLGLAKHLAQSIDSVSLVFQPKNNRPPIQCENLKVQKVISDQIYLTTLVDFSFSQITANHTIPVALKIQLRFANRISITPSLMPIGIHKKPIDFTWKIQLFQRQPFVKSSPWFKLQTFDRCWMSVAFWLNQEHRNRPIQIGLKANSEQHKLAMSIDRVSVEFTYRNGLIKKVTRILPQLIGNLVWFDLDDNYFYFAELSNNYTEPFQIMFRLHPATLEEPAHSETAIVQPLESHKTSFQPPIAITNCLFAPNPQQTLLLQQLNTLLVDQKDCDVHLDCQGIRLGAHRSILHTRSAFFKDLFMQQNDRSMFHFENVDAQTMADTLQFIYTETAPQIANTAQRLLSVANLMGLPELHDLAQRQLLAKAANPADTSSFAKLLDMFEVNELQAQAGTFIRTNMDDLLAKPQFEQELRQRPDVCFGLIAMIHSESKKLQI